MRTDDILALTNPTAADRHSCERRSAVIGFIGAAALILTALASAYSVRPVQGEAPDAYELEATAFSKALERSGTFSALPILF